MQPQLQFQLQLPLTKGALLIDNSFLEDFISCPRKAQYRYMQRRIPSGERNALNYGTAIHTALEYRYVQWNNSSPSPSQRQELTHVLQDYFGKNPCSEEDWRSVEFADETITEYLKRYNVEPFRLICDIDQHPMAELSFSVPLYVHRATLTDIDGSRFEQVIPIVYTGRIDLVVLWDNQLGIVDHKTSGMLGNTFIELHRVAPQFEGYCWALQKITGHEPSFFLINGIRTKNKPLKPAGGWDKWWDESFLRHKEYIKPGQLEEWRLNTIALIEEFFFHCVDKQYMPQKKKACTMYGKCPYYDVCYLPTSQRESELNSDKFTTNEWTPLKPLKDSSKVKA